MGTVVGSIKILNHGREPITRQLLVDTGATFTVIPADDLANMGIEPRVKRRLRTADGRVVERDGASAAVELMGKQDDVPVVFGEKEDMPVIGMTTLEILGFQIDDVSRQLRPRDYFFL